ncbi:Alpha-2-macroglobulin-like 6 [Homarus americanus]|uniref:Alpha-2-macroglobulin-like 6 n=1 Tax=Homarus americanus TaxID=6706 RepID=A0A8J5TH46_HOMAM|nr:Alpha-2-macroglobulin-like 6 [Homarus americanus]
MPPLGPDAVNSVEQQETQSLVCDACPLLAAAPANNCTLVNATCCKYWLCGDLPRNCSSKNGTVYQIDDQWKEEENCKTCRCLFSSIEGAYTKCWDTFCPGKSHKDCLTLQKPLGQCCPQYFCDNTTCLSQGLYYGIGETWETYVAPCGECECQSVGNGQPEALCQLEVCPTPPSDPLCRPIKHNRCCDLQWECTNEYLITTPDKWVAGGRASVCVFTVLNQETMVDLFISLSTKTSSNTSSVLLNTTVEGPGHVCTTLDVPNVSEYYGDLEIFGKVGAAMVSESLMVKLEEMGKTFVQTDKFLYMPGQVVKFRILTIVGAESKVSYEDLEEVWVTSPSGVRLAHWLKVNNSQGLVHLEFPLADEVEEGKYKIQTRTEVGKGYQVFEVEHYDLPRFEVTLSPPPYVLSSDQYIIFTICAEYNWGQEVEGSAWLVVHTHTHYYNGHLEDQHPLVNTTVQSFTGCVAVNVSTNNLTEEMYFHTLNVEAVVTEQGTGVTYEAFTEVKIHRQVVTFKMIKSERYFKPGLPFVFQVEARYAGEMLARGEPVLVCVADICNNYTTNNNGSVTSILPPHLIHQDTPAYVQVGAVDHQGGPGILGDLQPSESTFYIKTYYSPSCSSMALHLPSGRLECQPGQNIKVLIPVIFVTNNTDKVAVTTQVISRGQVIMTSIQERVLTASPLGLDEDLLLAPLKDPEGELVRGSFTIEVTLPPTASPTVYIIIWYSRTDGEVVSASGTIDVALCLTNPTTLTWHSSSSNGTNPPAPGDKTSFTLSANPNSICGLGVVDRSVEMLAREQPHQLSVHTLLDVVRGMEVQSWEHYDYLDLYSRCYQDYNYDYWDYDYPLPPIRKRRSATGMEDSYAVHYVDAFYAFRDAGLLVVTDLDLETRPCPHHVPDLFLPGIMPLDDMAVMAPVASPGESSEEEEDEQEEEGDEQEEEGDEQEEEGDTEEEEVRNGQDTRSYFPETWLWQLLVLDNTGETVEEVTLPDTVTEWVGKAVCVHPQNGVGFSGPASIITFTPFFLDLIAPPSARRGEQVPLLVSVFNYLNQSLPVKSSRYNASWYTREVCVGPGTQGLLQFTVTPSYAGDISLTFSANITWGAGDTCGNGTLVISTRDTITEVLRVTLEGVIKEEVHSSFICAGEGNVTFEMKEVAGVVNDSDRSFVGVSGDLLGPTLENLGHLVRLPSGCGEQNMLNFAPNVYILQYLNISNQTTPQLIIKATDYMSKGYQRELRYRREEGSYSAFGEQDQEGSTWLTSFVLKSFAGAKNFIMGGVSSGSDGFLGCLTAYVVIALTETGHHNSPSAVSNALQCILNDATPHNYYSGAIKAYALALTSSADVESYIALAYALLQKEPKDVSKGSQVEAAGYLMLAMMKVDSVRYANEGFLLAKTITAHRNGQGGFVNTQDTVVALEALAAFNQVYPPSDTNLQVTVTAGNQSTAFNITQENRLLLQTQHITEPLPYNVSVTPSGVGCVVMMAVHRYNIPEEPKSEAFSMNFTATQVSCSSSALRVCFAYLLQDNSSNMAVLELHLQTGYLALEKDLELLLEKEIIKRFDIEEAIVQLYLESVSRDETCVELEVLQKTVLEDPHPGTLTLYDYYEPHLRLTKKFTLEKNGC